MHPYALSRDVEKFPGKQHRPGLGSYSAAVSGLAVYLGPAPRCSAQLNTEGSAPATVQSARMIVGVAAMFPVLSRVSLSEYATTVFPDRLPPSVVSLSRPWLPALARWRKGGPGGVGDPGP